MLLGQLPTHDTYLGTDGRQRGALGLHREERATVRDPEPLGSHNHGDLQSRPIPGPAVRSFLRLQRYPQAIPGTVHLHQIRHHADPMDGEFHPAAK